MSVHESQSSITELTKFTQKFWGWFSKYSHGRALDPLNGPLSGLRPSTAFSYKLPTNTHIHVSDYFHGASTRSAPAPFQQSVTKLNLLGKIITAATCTRTSTGTMVLLNDMKRRVVNTGLHTHLLVYFETYLGCGCLLKNCTKKPHSIHPSMCSI